MTSPSPVPLRAKLIVASGALVVAAGLCEVAARVIYPAPPEPLRQPQLYYQSDPDLGFIHVPNQAGYLDDGLANINELGLRGALPEMPKPEGMLRVLAIGDSTTFGWGVDDPDTYPARLEGRLRDSRDRVDVVNGGVGAYDLRRAAGLLKHLGPRLEPDIVLVGLFWNDLPYEAVSPDGVPQRQSASTPGAGSRGRAASRPFRIGNNPSRLNQILRRSRALFAMRHAWLGAVAPTGAATNIVQWEMALLEGRETPAIDDAWRDIGETLALIRDMAEEGGFDVGIVIIPIRAQVEGPYPNAAYQTRVRPMAEALGMLVIDPLPKFLADPDPGSLFIPYDRMHFSAKGNALIAEAAIEVLTEREALTGGMSAPPDAPGLKPRPTGTVTDGRAGLQGGALAPPDVPGLKPRPTGARDELQGGALSPRWTGS